MRKKQKQHIKNTVFIGMGLKTILLSIKALSLFLSLFTVNIRHNSPVHGRVKNQHHYNKSYQCVRLILGWLGVYDNIFINLIHVHS